MRHRIRIRLAALWSDLRGQDMIEYALMAGLLVLTSGAIFPGVANNINTMYSRIGSVMSNSQSQGS